MSDQDPYVSASRTGRLQPLQRFSVVIWSPLSEDPIGALESLAAADGLSTTKRASRRTGSLTLSIGDRPRRPRRQRRGISREQRREAMTTVRALLKTEHAAEVIKLLEEIQVGGDGVAVAASRLAELARESASTSS